MLVTQFCPIFSDPMDYIACQASLSMGVSRTRILEWVAIPFSRDLPNPGIKSQSPALQADSLPSEAPGKPLSIYLQRFYSSISIAQVDLWHINASVLLWVQ